MMTAQDVLDVVTEVRGSGIPFWLDGGWGIDALLGVETRLHEDVDIVVPRERLAELETRLAARGFRPAPAANPGLPARLVLRDVAGRQVDLHPIVFDEHGNGHQELGDGTWGVYPAAGLAGEGVIAGRRVPCTTAELQLRHHLGYEPSERDQNDVRALAERFRFDVPPPYA